MATNSANEPLPITLSSSSFCFHCHQSEKSLRRNAANGYADAMTVGFSNTIWCGTVRYEATQDARNDGLCKEVAPAPASVVGAGGTLLPCSEGCDALRLGEPVDRQQRGAALRIRPASPQGRAEPYNSRHGTKGRRRNKVWPAAGMKRLVRTDGDWRCRPAHCSSSGSASPSC